MIQGVSLSMFINMPYPKENSPTKHVFYDTFVLETRLIIAIGIISKWLKNRKESLKGSRSHLQISLNITKLCKDERYTTVMMYMKSYSCRL